MMNRHRRNFTASPGLLFEQTGAGLSEPAARSLVWTEGPSLKSKSISDQ